MHGRGKESAGVGIGSGKGIEKTGMDQCAKVGKRSSRGMKDIILNMLHDEVVLGEMDVSDTSSAQQALEATIADVAE